MLRLIDNDPLRPRSSCSRRAFLHAGSLALGGLTLAGLLRARGATKNLKLPTTDKSVIFLFMHGGPPQTETFDPKMTAPAGVRSVTGEIDTSISGITFGSTLTQLAKLAHKFAVVRSFQTGDQTHDIKPIVGTDTLGANLGSLYSRVAGISRTETGFPTNVALFPRTVNPAAQAANMNFGKFGATGPLGPAYAPFVPGSGGGMREDLTLNIPKSRLANRRELLAGLDGIKRSIDRSGTMEGVARFQQQAFDTVMGAAADAFDLSKEDPRLVERYDTANLVPANSISKEWNNYNNYVDNAQTLGKLMLMARRLCEAGCGFVTVTTNFVWDMHADVNNATVEEGMRYCGLPFDHAVSTFIQDVEDRGLSEKILLVCCGEMGRTPKLNPKGGRDHWGGLAPLLVYGGGLKMGQVIGQSTRDAGEPASSPVTIKDLLATIHHVLFDIGQLRVTEGLPRDLVNTITGGQPIRELI